VATLEVADCPWQSGGMSPAKPSPARKAAAGGRGDEIATVRIELCDSDPLIWRQVEVRTATTLKGLHEIVQVAMDWENYHLWEFTVGGQRFGPKMEEDWGEEPRREAGKVRLRDVLRPGETVIDYLYDFGDAWEHRIVVTDIRVGDPALSYPRYVGGERNAPPEDCGGIPGFYDKLDAAADPGHPDHNEVKDWLGDYDPGSINELRIRFGLGRIANRRRAAMGRAGAKKV